MLPKQTKQVVVLFF